MADGGISETAIAGAVAAAAAEAEAAAAAAAVTATAATAATAAEAGAGAAALAGTAAEAAPVIAAAAPEAFTAAAAVPEVTAAAAPALTEAPFLGATASEPLLGPAVAAPEVVAPTTVPEVSLLGEATSTAVPGTTAAPEGLHSAAWAGNTGQFAPATTPGSPPGLLEQAGQWWNTASTGDKLAAGGKLLSGVGTAGSAASAAKGPPAKGPTHTIQPGQVGKPSGGEQQLAAIVEAMLKRRDAYQQGIGGGAPVAYRPRGLLG